MDPMGNQNFAPPTPPPQGPAAPPLSPDLLLQGMLQAPFPTSGKRKRKGKNLGGKEGNKAPRGASGKLQKALDLINEVINEVGPKSDVAASLSGVARNIQMQVDKMQGPDQNQILGAPPAPPPLGIGTPGQSPPGMGGGIQTPTNITYS